MKLPSFPHFYKLKLDDKATYEKLIAKYPPVSDISFPTLHIWWNLEGGLGLSSLNGNLVLNYNLSFDPENSGYGLIGLVDIDSSIQTIFAHQKTLGQEQRLVHTPEFVVKKIKALDRLKLEEEIDYHEYVISSQALAKLEGHDYYRTRRDVSRLLRDTSDKKLVVKSLDLSLAANKKLILDQVAQWEKNHPPKNDPDRTEVRAMANTINLSEVLGVKAFCLFLNDKLHAVVLYHRSAIDKDYCIVHHLRVDYSVPYLWDFIAHELAKAAVNDGVKFINMEMDLGIEGLRRYKQSLRPVDFFKKYRITPKPS